MSCNTTNNSRFRYPRERYSSGVDEASKYAHQTGHAIEPFGFEYSRCESDEKRKHIIHFNTADRDSADLKDPSNCVIRFSGISNCTRACITQAEIHHTQYIVNEYNNVLVYTSFTAPGPAVTTAFTIPAGNYTGTLLAVTLQAQFTAVIGPGTVVVTFDVNNNTFTFARTDAVNNTLALPFLTNPNKISNPANELIGLSKLQNYTATAGGASITSNIAVELNGPSYVLLQVKELAADNTSNFNSNVFAKIQCKTLPDSKLIYTCGDDYGSSGRSFVAMPQKITSLQVQLVNPDGRAYLGRQSNYSFSVLFESCGG